jgi:hypothetical protein
MSYMLAGIDVHKKKLAVVVAEVEVEDEYKFERRWFGSHPEQLGLLSEWLSEQQVEEMVMESTAQYWKPMGGIGTVLAANPSEARRCSEDVGDTAFSAGTIESWNPFLR